MLICGSGLIPISSHTSCKKFFLDFYFLIHTTELIYNKTRESEGWPDINVNLLCSGHTLRGKKSLLIQYAKTLLKSSPSPWLLVYTQFEILNVLECYETAGLNTTAGLIPCIAV